MTTNLLLGNWVRWASQKMHEHDSRCTRRHWKQTFPNLVNMMMNKSALEVCVDAATQFRMDKVLQFNLFGFHFLLSKKMRATSVSNLFLATLSRFLWIDGRLWYDSESGSLPWQQWIPQFNYLDAELGHHKDRHASERQILPLFSCSSFFQISFACVIFWKLSNVIAS